MVNVKQIWEETTNRLEKVYNRREAENISYLLFEDLLRVSKADILIQEQKSINQEILNGAINRLLANEPIQYVTGTVVFYGRRFEIQSGALIPRPETEELVELIVKENQIDTPKILDIGVGSGCIGISLALELNGEIFGTDVSDQAIKIASNNAISLGANVSFLNHDILDNPLPIDELGILVSNPPYIPESEQAKMHANVLKYEPQVALFVPDTDPLIFYRRIAGEGLIAIKNGGKIYFEIHESYGPQIKELLENFGYKNVKIHQDMQGKDRMISGEQRNHPKR